MARAVGGVPQHSPRRPAWPRAVLVLAVLFCVASVAAGLAACRRPKLRGPVRIELRSGLPLTGAWPADPGDVEIIRRARHGLPPPARLDEALTRWETGWVGHYSSEPHGDVPGQNLELEHRELVLGDRQPPAYPYNRTTCLAVLTALHGALVETLVQCRWPVAEYESSRAALEHELGPAFQIDRGGHPFVVSRRGLGSPGPWSTAWAVFRGPAYNAALEQVASLLGPQRDVTIPEDLADPYAVLLSATVDLPVGRYCFGEVPRGLTAVRALRDAGRVDLLRNVLRGLNPGGRYYAARALREMGSCEISDEQAIARLPEASPAILYCSFMSLFQEPPGLEGEPSASVLPSLDAGPPARR